MLANRLDDTRRQELLSRQLKEEALNKLIINKRQQIPRYTPPKPRVMPTILEVPSSVIHVPQTRFGTPTISGSAMRSVSLNTGLYGGYGKKILPAVPANNGLMTSMHAFVPGGTLKTAPITAVDSGDGSNWDVHEVRGLRKTSTTLSLSDGMGYQNVPARVPSHVATPAITTTKAENVKYREVAENAAMVKAKVGAAIKEVTKTVVKTEDDRPPVVQAKALMGYANPLPQAVNSKAC